MKWLEYFQLRYRAYKYRHQLDPGGIKYILSCVKPGQTVLDIGAHKGGYLYFFLKRVGIRGKVYAFEPQSVLFNYLSRLKKIFHWHQLQLEHQAISDRVDTVTLYIPGNKVSKSTSPGATIVEPKEHSVYETYATVATMTLDAYCLQYRISPDFIKIDVEGNEMRVFQGGQHILTTCKPRILVEIEARHIGKEQVLATFEIMHQLGYSGFFIKGKDQLPLIDFDFDQHQNTNDMKHYCNNFVFEQASV